MKDIVSPIALIASLSIALSACGNGKENGTVTKGNGTPLFGPIAMAVPSVSKTAANKTSVNKAEVSKCTFGGWSGDDDPKGLNVRAGPSVDAEILGVLPPPRTPEGEDPNITKFATEFDIVEAKNGWVRIENASVWDSEINAKLPAGWISGQMVRFQLQTEKAFAAPDPKSKILWQSTPGYSGVDVLGITDCRGEWAKVKFNLRSDDPRVLIRQTPKFAWFRGICSAQETSCDGVKGD